MLNFKFDDAVYDLKENYIFPQRKTKFSAGYDICLPISENLVIPSNKGIKVGLGFCLEVGEGSEKAYTVQIFARSSLAKKKGIVLTRPFFTFPAGEMTYAILYNYTSEDVVISPKENVLQAIILEDPTTPVLDAVYSEVGTENNFKLHPVNTSSSFKFLAEKEITLNPVEINLHFTNIKCKMKENEVGILQIAPSIVDNYNIVLANGVGIIDSDYYGNKDNDGNIGLQFVNFNYIPVTIPKGTVIGELAVLPYYTIDEDEKNFIDEERGGGFGSTSK